MLKGLTQKPESYRRKVAFYTSALLTLVILFSWAVSNGYIGSSTGQTVAKSAEKIGTSQAASVASAPSPMGAFWGGIVGEYDALKQSLSDVFVPFVTGIEVYNNSSQ